MVEQNTLVAVTLLLVLSDIVINVSNGKTFSTQTQQNDDYVSVVNWKPLEDLQLNRFKRNIDSDRRTRDTSKAGKDKDGEDELKTSKFLIPDKTHDQAVVSWSGNNNTVVFILTRERGDMGFFEFTDAQLWRSDDYGSSFQRINFTKNAVPKMIYKSSVNRNKMILTDVHNQCLYITEDNGLNWTTVHLTFEPSSLYLHPTMENWLLAYDIMYFTLYVSSDFGRTWKLLKEEVNIMIFWAVPGVDEDMLTVHMEVYDMFGPRGYEYVSCIAPNCRDVTPDKSLFDLDPMSLHVENEYIFVKKMSGNRKNLYVSYKRGPFRKAYFPLNVHPKDYDIIDTSDSHVFLAADHEENTVILYLSDITGQFYVTSLERVIADTDYSHLEADIYHIKGLKGHYIANQYIDDSLTNSRTVISYNKGVTWTTIKAPEEEKGKCKNAQMCSLHLHLSYSYRFYGTPRVESEREAPWLVMAHGVVGDNLIPINSCLYISRDGGKSWNKASLEQGLYKLNVIDQGGAITAVKHTPDDLTNQVFFSVDEGLTWHQQKFLDEKMFVDDILNSPRIPTLSISIFGRLSERRGRLVIKLDFSKLLDRKCEEGDYRDWNPGIGISENYCILGESIVIKKRKADAHCYNGVEYIRRNTTVSCLCRDADFECDYGFVRTSSGACAMAGWYSPSQIHWNCKEGEQTNRTNGYRKVGSDRCVGGVEGTDKYNTRLVPCTVAPPSGLRLSTQKTVMPLGKNVSFSLSQKHGSVDSTVYTWTFGDGSIKVADIGLSKAAVKVHAFNKPGRFNVTVVAENSNGSVSCTLVMQIEAVIHGVIVVTPYGAQLDRPTMFNVTLLGRENQKDFGPTHYVWKYGDEREGSNPYLTWSPTVRHLYNRTGHHNVTVEAVNQVSSVSKTFLIYVYNSVTVVRLHFSTNVDHLNSERFDWRNGISLDVRAQLSEILYVQSQRLIVSIPQIKPTIADVTILPNRLGGLTQEQIVFELQQKVLSQQIRFEFLHIASMYVTRVEVLQGNAPVHTNTIVTSTSTPHKQPVKGYKPTSSTISLTLYIAVPLAVLLVGALVAVAVVRARKRQKKEQRYSLIMNRQLGVTMLGDDEDDDEDFTGGGENIFECQDGDNSVVFNTPRESTLVMLSGSNHQGRELSLNC